MEKKRAIGIIAAVTILTVALALFFIFKSQDYEINRLEMYLTVGNYTGINVNTSALYFGTIGPGGSSKRFLSVENTYGKEVEVEISLAGDLAKWAKVSSNNFILAKDESKNLEVVAVVPINAAYGQYSGEMQLKFLT